MGFHGFHGCCSRWAARAKGLTRGKPAEWKGGKEIKYCFFLHLVCHRSGMSCWSFVYSLLQMICWSFSIGSTRSGKPHPQTRPKPCHGLGDNLTTGDYFHLLRTTSFGNTFPLWCGGPRWRSDHRKTRGLSFAWKMSRQRIHVASCHAVVWCIPTSRKLIVRRKESFSFHAPSVSCRLCRLHFAPSWKEHIVILWSLQENLRVNGSTMWGPPVISWFISPSNYSYKYHKP